MITVRTCASARGADQSPVFSCCTVPDKYQALHYHRPQSASQKSHWAITAADECHTFCESRDSGWSDADGNYWFFGFESDPIGTRGEVLAHFPMPQNLSDPWHGFPISTAAKAFMRRVVPLSVIESWSNEPGMPKYLENRLRKRQL